VLLVVVMVLGDIGLAIDSGCGRVVGVLDDRGNDGALAGVERSPRVVDLLRVYRLMRQIRDVLLHLLSISIEASHANRRSEEFALVRLELYFTGCWVYHIVGVDYVPRRRPMGLLLTQ